MQVFTSAIKWLNGADDDLSAPGLYQLSSSVTSLLKIRTILTWLVFRLSEEKLSDLVFCGTRGEEEKSLFMGKPRY